MGTVLYKLPFHIVCYPLSSIGKMQAISVRFQQCFCIHPHLHIPVHIKYAT